MDSSTQQSSEQTNLSKEGPKKINSIIFVIILVLVIGAIGYYLWPRDNQPSVKPDDNQVVDLSEFKVIQDNLTEEEKQDYFSRFESIQKTLDQDPNNFDALLQLGMIKKYIGDYKGAEAAWVKVGEITPKNSTSFGNLADLYANFLKDYDKAIIAYQTAITNSLNEVKNILFYRNFHDFYLNYLNDKQTAEQVLLEGIESNSGNSELFILLAGFYRDEGNISKAIEYYEKALEIDPEDYLVEEELEKLK